MDTKFDPQKTKQVVDVLIKILTIISGFLVGLGTASAATIIHII